MSSKKKIDVYLQYYLPHVSGLTNAAVDISEYIQATDNYDVHVHCTAAKNSDALEIINGVTIHRHKTWFTLGRASFAPGVIKAAFSSRERDAIVHIHAPYPEAALITWITRKNRKSIITYQCDSGITNFGSSIISKLLDLSHQIAFRYVKKIIFTSRDYLESSRLAKKIEFSKLAIIPAPSRPRKLGQGTFRVAGFTMVGFLGRPTSEKGLDILLAAFDRLPENFMLLIAGPTETTENNSNKNLEMARLHSRIKILGWLEDSDISNFYASLDIFTLPSTNSFEAFGIVQVEAISAGVPVVVSNIPGVRTVVQNSQFGVVAEPGNAIDLANKILDVSLSNWKKEEGLLFVKETYLNPVPLEEYARLLDSNFG